WRVCISRRATDHGLLRRSGCSCVAEQIFYFYLWSRRVWRGPVLCAERLPYNQSVAARTINHRQAGPAQLLRSANPANMAALSWFCGFCGDCCPFSALAEFAIALHSRLHDAGGKLGLCFLRPACVFCGPVVDRLDRRAVLSGVAAGAAQSVNPGNSFYGDCCTRGREYLAVC